MSMRSPTLWAENIMFPHGLANAVILPMLLEAYGEKIHKKLSRLAIAAGLADEDTPCDEAAGRFIQAVKDMKKRFGIGDKIPEIQETDIPKLAHYADKEANPLYPVPVLMDASELEPFYRMLMTDTGEDPDKRPDAENNIREKEHMKMTEQEIKDIVTRQRKYFYTGATLPVNTRLAALQKLYNAISGHETEIHDALKKDLGKSGFESYMCETGLVLEEISYMLKHTKRFAGEKTVRTPLAQFHSRSYKKPSPYGVTLIMSPWNYPFMLTLSPLVDALAAGNTAVVKPSAYSPHTSEVIRHILSECFEPQYVAVVTGGRAENTCLLHEHFDYIFFTGSQAVGKEVMRNAGRISDTDYSELGGKSPCIVDQTVDIKLAARRIVFGKYLNCGQTCVAPDYVYCHRSVKDKLIKEVQKEIRRQFGKQPLQNSNYGKIINEKHFDRIMGLIDERRWYTEEILTVKRSVLNLRLWIM